MPSACRCIPSWKLKPGECTSRTPRDVWYKFRAPRDLLDEFFQGCPGVVKLALAIDFENPDEVRIALTTTRIS